eukprot:TRINITY_DN11619_c0_g1_i2.p1 TRINITY_DN11619_c0_g1~~TRINITY_DN11619_c0_g1_i2.p1  ORF type:complete len:503 (+),score=149.11 TRINITY_DN11619_c0_g1_i2:65-1510(+)
MADAAAAADGEAQILNLQRSEFGPDFARATRALRRQEGALLNRLRSVHADACWLQHTLSRADLGDAAFPVLANLRCGAWYVPPDKLTGGHCHFKSTDGHYGKWAFSLSRPNVSVLKTAAERGGALLVDSTRKGKEFPDAFNRTVPVWCLVVNTVLGLDDEGTAADVLSHLPASERDQILAKLPKWTEAARDCGVDWSSFGLRKPLRCVFAGRGVGSRDATAVIAAAHSRRDAAPLVLVSVSDPTPAAEDRGGWAYVQGAGDDHQTWSAGLSPAAFWEHVDELVHPTQTPAGCDSVADAIVSASGGAAWATPDACGGSAVRSVPGTPLVIAPLSQVGSVADSCCVRVVDARPADADGPVLFDGALSCALDGGDRELTVVVREESKQDLVRALPTVLEFLRPRLLSGRPVVIACATGNGASVAVAVAAFAGLSADGRSFSTEPAPRATKDSMRKQLSWLSTFVEGAAPSRQLMKQLNRYFCSP